jgi:hypothetical protein
MAAIHGVLPRYTRRGTSAAERSGRLPGDDIVPNPKTENTMAITIHAAPSAIWPWLVQMGQGRGGFYTHEWVENVLGADIHNADHIISAWQGLKTGDTVRLTSDPYFGQPGQFMTVAEIQPERTLVFRQTLPNGSPASWAFLLQPEDGKSTRVVMRRRGGDPTFFDRMMAPDYVFMDRGMLQGLRERVEGPVLSHPRWILTRRFVRSVPRLRNSSPRAKSFAAGPSRLSAPRSPNLRDHLNGRRLSRPLYGRVNRAVAEVVHETDGKRRDEIVLAAAANEHGFDLGSDRHSARCKQENTATKDECRIGDRPIGRRIRFS